MSQRDLVAELRGARIAAPAELRERVRSIAAGAPAPRRRFTWRRALVVAAAGRRGDRRRARRHAAASNDQTAVSGAVGPGNRARREVTRRASDRAVRHPSAAARRGSHLTVHAGRACSATAPTLALRVPTPDGVSDGVKRALADRDVARRLPDVGARRAHGKAALGRPDAEGPRARTSRRRSRGSPRSARSRASRSTSQDLQAGLNATDRTIARLQAQLATLRAEPSRPTTVQAQIAALTTRIERLQRGRGGDDPRRALRDGLAAPRRRRRDGRAGAPRPRAAARPRRRVALDRDRRRLRARARRAAASLLVALGWLACARCAAAARTRCSPSPRPLSCGRRRGRSARRPAARRTPGSTQPRSSLARDS